MKLFYFTATGNSLFVAKKISESLRKVELLSIPKVLKNNKKEYEDEMIGLVFPTYNSNIPKIVRDFLTGIKLKAKYLFAVCTYGNKFGTGGDGNLLGEFEKFTNKLGLSFNYLNSILMVDNYLDSFEVKEEINKIPSKKIDKNLAQIVDDIKNKRFYRKKVGLKGKISTFICRPLVDIQDKGLASKDYIIDKNCNGCGTCAKVCPSGNITLIENKPVFGNKCLKCYACIHNCPNIAIHLKTEKSKERWRNENIYLKEIIAANNQNK